MSWVDRYARSCDQVLCGGYAFFNVHSSFDEKKLKNVSCEYDRLNG